MVPIRAGPRADLSRVGREGTWAVFETFGLQPTRPRRPRDRNGSHADPAHRLGIPPGPAVAGRGSRGRRTRRSPPAAAEPGGEGGPARQPLDRARATGSRGRGWGAGARRGGRPGAERRTHGGRVRLGRIAFTRG